MYLLPALVTLLALLFYAVLILRIGMQRGKRNLAPSAKGDDAFERLCRVQVNTSEQLILFIPSLWAFAVFQSQLWATILGAVWILGRLIYLAGYTQSFAKRGPGFLLTLGASVALLIGGLVGVVQAIFLTA